MSIASGPGQHLTLADAWMLAKVVGKEVAGMSLAVQQALGREDRR